MFHLQYRSSGGQRTSEWVVFCPEQVASYQRYNLQETVFVLSLFFCINYFSGLFLLLVQKMKICNS